MKLAARGGGTAGAAKGGQCPPLRCAIAAHRHGTAAAETLDLAPPSLHRRGIAALCQPIAWRPAIINERNGRASLPHVRPAATRCSACPEMKRISGFPEMVTVARARLTAKALSEARPEVQPPARALRRARRRDTRQRHPSTTPGGPHPPPPTRRCPRGLPLPTPASRTCGLYSALRARVATTARSGWHRRSTVQTQFLARGGWTGERGRAAGAGGRADQVRCRIRRPTARTSIPVPCDRPAHPRGSVCERPPRAAPACSLAGGPLRSTEARVARQPRRLPLPPLPPHGAALTAGTCARPASSRRTGACRAW